MDTRGLIVSLTPPALLGAMRRWRRRAGHVPAFGLYGDFASWDEALAASGGYDSDEILADTLAAAIAVRDGEALFERDSVLFHEPEYSWPLLAGLLRAASLDDGRLDVLDFGGSLGSTYRQHEPMLDHLASVRWNVVEQPKHVAAGRAELQDESLRFYESIEQCLADAEPNVALLSGVLQYLPDPGSIVGQLASARVSHLIIDRTPVYDGAKDRICVQKAASHVYAGSYPSWVFSADALDSRLEAAGFNTIGRFAALDTIEGPVDVRHIGMLLDRASGAPASPR